MNAASVHCLLRECGFRNVLWPSPLGQLWGVVGELDGGLRLVVTCMPTGRNEFRLHVSPAVAKEWLQETLAAHGAPNVRIVSDPLDAPPPPASLPWLTLSLGLVSMALFGWVLFH